MPKTICVLIPSYNESKTIGHLVKELRARDFTVYVVDDGSTDDTAKIAEADGAVVVRHKRNKGKGASLREGFAHILKKGFEAVIVMDGDGQHHVSDINNFMDKMSQTSADIVIGNRMQDVSTMPPARIRTNRFMSRLISLVAGCDVPDTQSGFRLIKRSVLEKLKFKSSNYEIESEMIIRAARAGFRIESVPIKTIYQDEVSRIDPFMDTLRFIWFIFKAIFYR
ncbi:MAG: glycosyltransferase family 2 protein [Candidatus Omnitrophica bacterium]|nr:glycosyltransferase family 2 protein [Candidatus Omnitrophota bacterium]MCM8790138.1 glycosyltransferase family 2 protein [Candidatus Omnitrophota bacterium]